MFQVLDIPEIDPTGDIFDSVTGTLRLIDQEMMKTSPVFGFWVIDFVNAQSEEDAIAIYEKAYLADPNIRELIGRGKNVSGVTIKLSAIWFAGKKLGIWKLLKRW